MNPCVVGVLAKGPLLPDGPVCPDYSTVTLAFTAEPYAAPSGDEAQLQFLPCPYEPPPVE
jgi:hypothetical protein